jgi:hypothetical protein
MSFLRLTALHNGEFLVTVSIDAIAGYLPFDPKEPAGPAEITLRAGHELGKFGRSIVVAESRHDLDVALSFQKRGAIVDPSKYKGKQELL